MLKKKLFCRAFGKKLARSFLKGVWRWRGSMKEFEGRWQENADYGRMVQSSQQYVALSVKVCWVGIGYERLRIEAAYWADIPVIIITQSSFDDEPNRLPFGASFNGNLSLRLYSIKFEFNQRLLLFDDTKMKMARKPRKKQERKIR